MDRSTKSGSRAEGVSTSRSTTRSVLCPRPHQHPAPEGTTMVSVWPRRISKPIRITTTASRSPLRLHFFSRSVPGPAPPSAFASASVTRFHSSLPSAPTSPTPHRTRPGSVTMAAPSLQAAHGLVDFVNASPTRECCPRHHGTSMLTADRRSQPTMPSPRRPEPSTMPASNISRSGIAGSPPSSPAASTM